MTELKNFKLPKPLKRKWLAALRSRKFKQGEGELFDNNGTYCCLGVLGTVCGINPSEMRGHEFLEDGLQEKIGFEFPKSIQNVLAVFNDGSAGDRELEEDIRSYLKSKRSMVRLTSNGKPFGEIANWIEKNL